MVQKTEKTASGASSNQESQKETCAGCVTQTDSSPPEAIQSDLEPYLRNGWLELADGKRVPLASSVQVQRLQLSHCKKPVVRGQIGETLGNVLSDTGCSGVIVKGHFVDRSQFTGKHGYMQMVDNTVRRVPLANVGIDTTYFTGTVDA